MPVYGVSVTRFHHQTWLFCMWCRNSNGFVICYGLCCYSALYWFVDFNLIKLAALNLQKKSDCLDSDDYTDLHLLARSNEVSPCPRCYLTLLGLHRPLWPPVLQGVILTWRLKVPQKKDFRTPTKAKYAWWKRLFYIWRNKLFHEWRQRSIIICLCVIVILHNDLPR